jgi:AbrB family looped-hinge helix DNA binding protein
LNKRISAKCAQNGQFVLPKEIRDAWGISGGSFIFFEINEEDGELTVSIKPEARTLRSAFGKAEV